MYSMLDMKHLLEVVGQLSHRERDIISNENEYISQLKEINLVFKNARRREIKMDDEVFLRAY